MCPICELNQCSRKAIAIGVDFLPLALVVSGLLWINGVL